ncbi:MAG: proton-conducting transporter membrane subunit [Candidatus Omnitrophota bacterium]|jgi:multicomponent Na+:H+ antiporter subunit D
MQLVPYVVVIPLTAAFLIPLVGKKIKLAGEILSGAATFLLLAVSFLIASSVITHKVLVYKVGNWAPPAGIPMVVDGLSAFMLVTVNIVAFMAAVYAIDYVKKFTDTWKFYSLFMLMLSGINGVLIAGDIFNMYVLLEIAAISGYCLVAFGTGPDELEAAFKYAVMGIVASAFILLGIAFLYSYTSTLNMADMASVLAAKEPARVMQFVSVLFIMGFGLKAALVPFHAWLPYAHSSAPAPVSAMLSGVSIKVLGIYALTRILFNIFGMTPAISSILIALAVISMLAGSVLAFGQSDIKRLFAYSSISQIGYIALGLAIATPLSLLGALFHLFNHSLAKSLLFLNSGSIERMTGTRDMNKMSGVLSTSPVVGYTGLVGAFSICGMPPLGGFWSKLIIILACLQAGHPVLAFIAILASVLTLAYYFKALSPVLFGRGRRDLNVAAGKRISFAMAAPVVILACLSIVSVAMLLPNPANVLLKDAVAILSSGKDYAGNIMGAFK